MSERESTHEHIMEEILWCCTEAQDFSEKYFGSCTKTNWDDPRELKEEMDMKQVAFGIVFNRLLDYYLPVLFSDLERLKNDKNEKNQAI